MGIAERKEKQKLEIRKLILEASMKLFVEEGFENVSIRKIADLIEYSPTTVYLYFKDKDEIFYELHNIGFLLFQEMNKDLPAIEDPLARLHKMGGNYIHFGLANQEYYDLMFIQRAPMEALTQMKGPDCGWAAGDSAFENLKATLEECMEKGSISRTSLDVLAMTVWGMVHGWVSLAIRGRFEKMMPKEQILPMMLLSLDFMIDTIAAK
ncbi:MAG: TetR/AcrR family transcriptional regulator [Puia sp.]|nr:TetR/AcrR family transcriptional regulator [Puia sp.]